MSFFLSKLIGSNPTGASPTNASSVSSAVAGKSPVLSPTSAPPRSKYHMRVLLRGDKETGKSALLKRLQGGGFIEQHVVTPQIAASSIQWSYKTSEESVSVEVWDVVDRAPGKPAPKPASAATTPPQTPSSSSAGHPAKPAPAASFSAAPSSSSLPLDAASAPDLYANVHAVLFLIDPSREWTFSYVKSQLPSIPAHIDVLLLLNFRDLPDSERTAVTTTTIEQYMRGVGDRVRYVECSMRVGYGLKQIQSFLNIPFLHVKKDRLRREMAELEREVEGAAAELELMSELDYTSYCKWLSAQVSEREKDMSEEERKIELEKRIQQERLMLLLAEQRKQEEAKKAALIKQEADRQAKERERAQAEERKRVEKEAKNKKKSSTALSSSTATAATPATPSQPSLVIDKAKERLELDKENLDDFHVEDSSDDFFGEPSTSAAVHSELQARQDRTRPSEEQAEDEQDAFAEEDELDVGGRAANGLGELKERDEEALDDDDVLDEPAWELDEPVAAYSSPFGVGGYGGGKTAEDKERERREVKEREREAEKHRERAKQAEREARAERKQKELQREREVEDRVRRERREVAEPIAPQPLPEAPQAVEQADFAEEDEPAEDVDTFKRPAKQYSFDDDDDNDSAAAGPVFDDDDNGDESKVGMATSRPVVLHELRGTSGETSRPGEEAEDELDMDFSSLHMRPERDAHASTLLEQGPANSALPAHNGPNEDGARVRREEQEERVRREEEQKSSLIFVPTASAPAVPDADLDIFGAAGGAETPRKEKERSRHKADARKGSAPDSANGGVAFDSFYGGQPPVAASTTSSSASSAPASLRARDGRRDKKSSRARRSDSERSAESDSLEHDDVSATPRGKARDGKRDSKHAGKEADKGDKRRTVKADEGLEDDLELDQPVDAAAEIEQAKKERARKEKEAREKDRRKEKEKSKPTREADREKERRKSRRTATSEEESEDEEEEESRRRRKDKERKSDGKERSRDKKTDGSERRKKRGENSEDSESEQSEEEDKKRRKARKEKEREEERRKARKQDKQKERRNKHSDSDELSSAEGRSSKPRKGAKKNSVDAFYDDDAYSSKRATSGAAPVVVSRIVSTATAMGSHPSAAQGKSGFFSNLLRSSK